MDNVNDDIHRGCFTRHRDEDILGVLEWLKKTPLPYECLDAFLYNYKRTGDINDSVFFACCEWDC